MRKLLKPFWEYLREAYWKWWWAAYGSAIAAYELVARLLPPEVVMPALGREALYVVGVLIAVISPFPVYWKLRSELKAVRDSNYRESFDQLLQSRFGPDSALSIEIQRQTAVSEFDRLEAEILRGDFSHRREMLAYKDIVLRLLKGAPQLHLHHYQTRAEKILKAVNDYDAHAASA